jgi:hypothetical protein
MEQLSVISAINLMPYTKAERETFTRLAVNQILSGNMDVHQIGKVIVALKSIEETVKAIQSDKEVREYLSDLIEGKTLELEGATITKSERKNFDYKGDQNWVNISRQIAELDEQRKSLEGQLKILKQPVAIEETGEMMYPAAFTVSEVITVKIK